jgi:glycosyltransferase involved in cell wall biosynthesis
MKISIIRGAFANPFELQNFYPLKNQYDIQVITSRHPISSNIELPVIPLLSFTDIPSFPYKYPILNRLFGDAHHLFGLDKAIEGSDIAHVAETYYGYTVQALKLKEKGLVKKVVSTVWENIPFNNETLSGRRLNKVIARAGIDHFLAVTTQAKNVLIQEGIDESKISVIPMGVDLSRFKTKKRTHQDINILFVGRLVDEKGIEDVFKSFTILKSKNPNLSLTIVGQGPLKKHYINTPGVTVVSAKYDQMPNIYSQADILVAPSRDTPTWKEQFGMVLVEAMASGLPIVTTKSGAIGEVCGDTAIYTSNSVSELANKLDVLISDRNLRYNMGNAARVRAEKCFDHINVAKQISSIYENLKI